MDITRFPYNMEQLKAHSIFPYYVMDGGAYYVTTDLVGSDWDAEVIAKGLRDGTLFETWIKDGKFDWDLPRQRYIESKVGAPVEKYVWLNRLYFLMVIANQFLKTKDESYAEQWYHYFHAWIETYPRQNSTESDDWELQLVWKEMQVAWRLLSVIHSLAMLTESATLTSEKWDEIYEFINIHIEQLLMECRGHIEQKTAHNHVLQMGVALLYVGCLFPQFEHAEEYISVGRKIVEIQLEYGIDSDGGSAEDSTSYSLFITRLYIEAALLLQKSHRQPIEGLWESVAKQYEWIYQMSSPKGNTILVNDSYNLSVLRELEYVKEWLPLTIPEKTSVIFKESKSAVLRNKNFDVYIDGMNHSQWHQHAGRPQFIVYFKGDPFIVDSGCCGYDHHNMHQYLWGEWAHNTVCISKEKHPDKTQKPIDNVELISASPEQNFVEYCVKGSRDGVSFTRNRRIELLENQICVTDTIEADQDVNMEVRVHFAPLDVISNATNHHFVVRAEKAECDLETVFSGTVEQSFLEYTPVVNEETKFTFAPVAVAETYGKQAVVKMAISVK